MDYTDYTIQRLDSGDLKYPGALLDLKSPPKEIYYRGNLEDVDYSKCLAIVGSRLMTNYGKQVLEMFIPDLVAAGVIIVSGFMYGVDTEAHKLAVKYGGKTIAVFGNGLNIVYPVENDKLYSQILESGGVVISEYAPLHKPHLWTYPARNRIVAALSLMGVLVVEAGEKSGSLVTVKWGKKLKRKIYAVPGPITSSVSIGTNQVIQNKTAEVVTSVGNIVILENKKSLHDQSNNLSDLGAKIYQILLRESMTLDELSFALDTDITQISSEVSIMSLRGVVSEMGGKLYILKSK